MSSPYFNQQALPLPRFSAGGVSSGQRGRAEGSAAPSEGLQSEAHLHRGDLEYDRSVRFSHGSESIAKIEHRVSVKIAVKGLPYMTSAKWSDFFTPSSVTHKSADFVPFVWIWGPPSLHPLRTSFMEAPLYFSQPLTTAILPGRRCSVLHARYPHNLLRLQCTSKE